MSYCVNGFRIDSCHDRAPLVLVVVVALFMVQVFIYFFQKFPNFYGQMCGLGLISVRLRFPKFLPSVVQPTAHLSWISVTLQAMDEKVFNYNHCLFVLYLTIIAFRYEWISDIKFLKFLDKDWIWIFKKFIGYGTGVEKSISAHLCLLLPFCG